MSIKKFYFTFYGVDRSAVKSDFDYKVLAWRKSQLGFSPLICPMSMDFFVEKTKYIILNSIRDKILLN